MHQLSKKRESNAKVRKNSAWCCWFRNKVYTKITVNCSKLAHSKIRLELNTDAARKVTRFKKAVDMFEKPAIYRVLKSGQLSQGSSLIADNNDAIKEKVEALSDHKMWNRLILNNNSIPRTHTHNGKVCCRSKKNANPQCSKKPLCWHQMLPS